MYHARHSRQPLAEPGAALAGEQDRLRAGRQVDQDDLDTQHLLAAFAASGRARASLRSSLQFGGETPGSRSLTGTTCARPRFPADAARYHPSIQVVSCSVALAMCLCTALMLKPCNLAISS